MNCEKWKMENWNTEKWKNFPCANALDFKFVDSKMSTRLKYSSLSQLSHVGQIKALYTIQQYYTFTMLFISPIFLM